jgi:chemosensory pili system protein ChpA (sensor histidine kinase/response regulator)
MSELLQFSNETDPRTGGTKDLAPLAWVLNDLRQSMPMAIMGLRRAALASKSTALEIEGWQDDLNLLSAQRQFEQAAGALAMVGQSETAKILNEAKTAVETFIQKPVTCTEEAVAHIQRAGQAVINFSQARLSGHTYSPVALFPSYRAVHHIHRTGHIHPADLWPPLWRWQVLTRPTVPAGVLPADSDRMAIFDQALLGSLRSADPASAQKVAELCSALAHGSSDELPRTYWHIAAGFFEAISLKLLTHTFEIKRAMTALRGSFIRQHLGTGQLAQHAREMVFFCACARPTLDLHAPHLEMVRKSYGLEEASAIDYQTDTFSQRDHQRWAVLHEKLGALIDSWAAVVSGQNPEIAVITQQLANLSAMATQAAPESAELLRELMGYLHSLQQSQQAPNSAIAMEVAVALLTLQAACEDPYSAGDLLNQRCQQLTRRLRQARQTQHVEALDDWMVKIFHRGATERSMTSLVSALNKVLQGVERCLERYFADAADPRALPQALDELEQADGIFAMLGLEQAHLATKHLREQIASIAREPTSGVTPHATQTLWAANLGALRVITDALVLQPALAKTLFHFDASAGQLVSSARPAHARPEPAPLEAASQGPLPGHDLPTSVEVPSPRSQASVPDLAEGPGAEIMAVFFVEVRQLLTQADHTIRGAASRTETDVQIEDIRVVRRAFHTLKGGARMVGLNELGEAAWAFEQLCNAFMAQERDLDVHILPLSYQALLCFHEWIEAIEHDQAVIWNASEFRVSADALRLQGIMRPLRADPVTKPTVELYREVGPLRLSEKLFQVFTAEAADHINRLEQLVQQVVDTEPDPDHVQSIQNLLHALQGSASTVGFSGLATVARFTEQALQGFTPSTASPLPTALHPCVAEMQRLLQRFSAGHLEDAQPDVIALLQASVPIDSSSTLDADGNTLDADLWPTFRDEGRELLSALDRALRMWTAQPDDATHADHVRRLLHTLKGSARSAGAAQLGTMAHSLESALSEKPEDLSNDAWLSAAMEYLDTMLAHFDGLQGVTSAGTTLAPAPQTQTSPIDPPLQDSRRTVRVSAEHLDRVLSQCSDVLVARSRMQSHSGSMLVTLEQLSLNASRLREQLRALEMQSDLQMQSRNNTADGHSQSLDPLELDRFTRLQEISRMMAESADDLGALNKNLRDGLTELDRDLVLQKRHGQELQQEVLGMRLVAFDGVSDRLYAVVRQTSKHAGRSVRLDIKGSATKVDRSMLERLAPCLEHLVRNAVIHGIETSPERLALGKPPTGEIRVAVQQLGQHIHIDVRDDGAGLRKDRIRSKAIAQGLLADNVDLSDEDAIALLVRSGFSTSEDVDMFAGRGVGMDVVQSEVRAMGGYLTIQSEPNRGLCFAMVFPVTTGLTQIVLFRVGNLTFGAPRTMLLQVLEQPALPAGPSSTTVQVSGYGEVDLFWAGDLLEGPDPSPLETRHQETIAVFGSPGSVVALRVTEVLGDREMAVKDLGPQLAKLPALVTVSPLPTGDLVLIYDPLALARAYGRPARRRQLARATDQQHDAVQYFQARSSRGTVLVVDDSITVRRVTQRLLQREGIRVVLAQNGLEALEKLKTVRPDLILSDIEMPHMDGFDLIRAVRADPSSADIPFIIISSRVGQKHRDIAQALGVNHYLGKPYSEEALLALVRTYSPEKSPA